MISSYVRMAWIANDTGYERMENVPKIGGFFNTAKVIAIQMYEGHDKELILTFAGMGNRWLLAEFSSRNARNRWIDIWKDMCNTDMNLGMILEEDSENGQ
jgi:hypothetical protein